MRYIGLRATPKSSAVSRLFAAPYGMRRGVFPGRGKLGVHAAELALGLGELHAFAGLGADESPIRIR